MYVRSQSYFREYRYWKFQIFFLFTSCSYHNSYVETLVRFQTENYREKKMIIEFVKVYRNIIKQPSFCDTNYRYVRFNMNV